MVTVAPRDVYFRLWEKVGQPEGFVFPWKMANMEESRIASNMRLFGRYTVFMGGQCPFQPEFGELQKWSMVIRSRLFHTELCLWWIAHFLASETHAVSDLWNCLQSLMKNMSCVPDVSLVPLKDVFWGGCSKIWHTCTHWTSQGVHFHLEGLEGRLAFVSFGPACPAHWILGILFQNSFLLLFCLLLCSSGTVLSLPKHFKKLPMISLSIMFTFPYFQLSVCDLTSKNQYNSQIFSQKDQLRHPTKSLAQQGLYILILYFRVHGF